MQKPSIPKGTRDFSASEMQRRNYIFDTIKKYFRRYGFEQIETPAMESLSTLTGKYGEEGDQLLFKILNSRVHDANEVDKEKMLKEFQLSLEKPRNTADLTEKALRYDLTVPFARYVVMRQHELTFPFKRFQIQPVWRADKPQKGRYREFFQCDADIIGSNSLVNEIELIRMMENVYNDLQIPVTIKLNNRKILAGIAETLEAPDKIIDITVAIDKLDKIGRENVEKELSEKGLSNKAIQQLSPIFESKGDNREKMKVLENFLQNSETGKKGIEELNFVLNYFSKNPLQQVCLELDITLARGLNYYTGSIIEVKANAGSLSSSITGGGRYDDLTGIFGLKGMSGVGISFGIDRIFDVMNDLDLFKNKVPEHSSVQLLFVNFGETEQLHVLQLLPEIREQGLCTELYPDASKLKKQLDYADKKKIPFVCIIGSEEINSGTYTLKNMQSGEQKKLNIQEIIQEIKTTCG